MTSEYGPTVKSKRPKAKLLTETGSFPVQAPTLDTSEVIQAMQQAESLDELLVAFAMGVSRHLKSVQIYSRQKESLKGVLKIEGEQLDMEVIHGLEFPMTGPSLVSRVVSDARQYIGPAPETGPSAEILAEAGIERVEDLVLIPLSLCGKTFCLLIGHHGSELVSDEVSEAIAAMAIEVEAGLDKRFACHDIEEQECCGGDSCQAPPVVMEMTAELPPPVVMEMTAELPPQRKENELSAEDLDFVLMKLEQKETYLAATERLLAHRDHAIETLVGRFPGDLKMDRHAAQGPLPPASECSAVLNALVVLGRPVIPRVESLLRRSNPDIRFYVVHLLSERLFPESITLLASACRDDDPDVKKLALCSLKKFKSIDRFDEVEAELHTDLGHPDPRLRKEAALALGALGVASAVPVLVELLAGAEKTVSQTAHDALVEITKQDFKMSQKKWLGWWQDHKNESRTDWLVDGLVHKNVDINLSAVAELEELKGETIGYTRSMSKKDKATLRRRCREWLAFRQWWEDNHMVSDTPRREPRLLESSTRK